MVINHSTSAEEVAETRTLQKMRWQEVQKHYDGNYFDFNVLLQIKNRDGLDWKVPPTWRHVSEIGHTFMRLLCKTQFCAECCF